MGGKTLKSLAGMARAGSSRNSGSMHKSWPTGTCREKKVKLAKYKKNMECSDCKPGRGRAWRGPAGASETRAQSGNSWGDNNLSRSNASPIERGERDQSESSLAILHTIWHDILGPKLSSLDTGHLEPKKRVPVVSGLLDKKRGRRCHLWINKKWNLLPSLFILTIWFDVDLV
jgi:hypothetical protein